MAENKRQNHKYFFLKTSQLVPSFLLTYRRDYVKFDELTNWATYLEDALLNVHSYDRVLLKMGDEETKEFLYENKEYYKNSDRLGLIKGFDEEYLRRKVSFMPVDLVISVVYAPNTIEELNEKAEELNKNDSNELENN